MEEENWPWLDFFFSSMTRSGKPGALIAGIYDVAQDRHDLDALVDVVARNVTAHSGRSVGALERFGIRRGVGPSSTASRRRASAASRRSC